MKLIYRYICLALGAILGAACGQDSDENNDPIAPEYGVPTGTVTVSGVVQDAEGQGIEGIEIELTNSERDTTDVLGRFSIQGQGIFLPCLYGNTTCQVQARDIDGAANGSYIDASVDLDLQQTAPGQGGWDMGTFVDQNVNIVMDPERASEGEKP